MTSRQPGWVHIGHGERVRTIELVERLRRYRGRLTKKLLCRALGCTDKATYAVVARLCHEYAIPTADDPHPMPAVVAMKRAALGSRAELARLQLQAEIARHQANVRDGLVMRPYKRGVLEW